MSIENRILFVEGIDDLHTILAICEQLEVEETFRIIVPDGEGKIPKRNARQNELGGIDNVLKAAQLNLTVGSSAVERIGIVIDADEDLKARWQKVSSILEKAGYNNLPDSADANGTIIKQEFSPTFGVWIMPDNLLERGYLETFLSFLVPENSKSWEQAKNCVANLEEKPFVKPNVDHTTKAEIHTFLAWQAEPGKPFGQSITAKYLKTENLQCEKFADWLRRLFVD